MIKLLALALVGGLAGVAVVVVLAGGPPPDIGTPADAQGPATPPAPGPATTGASTAATSGTIGARSHAEPPTREVFDDERYRVRAGDTLWDIATRHYEDPSAAMGRIKTRNGFRRDMLLAGEVLILPASGRRTAGSRADARCRADEATTDDSSPEP